MSNSVISGTQLSVKGKRNSTIAWYTDQNYSMYLVENKLVNTTNTDITIYLYAVFSYGAYASAPQTYVVSIINNSYYAEIDAVSGNELLLDLRDLITDTHTYITSYEDCKEYLPYTDEDLNNSNRMILFYTGESIEKSDNLSNDWNREHVWCRSQGWFQYSGAGADLHHIRPCDISVNSSRGNTPFGESEKYYEPDDSYKGDVARIIFYLLVRYEEADDCDLSNCVESIEMLLEWNELDPVDAGEEYRNDYIETIQGNRNPFIDNEDYAEAIWG